MGKFLLIITRARAVLHTIAIIASAAASALAASSVGGDPVLGATIGAAVNTAVAVTTA